MKTNNFIILFTAVKVCILISPFALKACCPSCYHPGFLSFPYTFCLWACVQDFTKERHTINHWSVMSLFWQVLGTTPQREWPSPNPEQWLQQPPAAETPATTNCTTRKLSRRDVSASAKHGIQCNTLVWNNRMFLIFRWIGASINSYLMLTC